MHTMATLTAFTEPLYDHGMFNSLDSFIARRESNVSPAQPGEKSPRLTWKAVLSACFLPVLCGDTVLALPDTAWLF